MVICKAVILIRILRYTERRTEYKVRGITFIPHPPHRHPPSSFPSSTSSCFSYRSVENTRRMEKRGWKEYFGFKVSSTSSSALFIFFLAAFKLSSFPCVDPVSRKCSLTIKVNIIDVQTTKVKTNLYPLYHGGALQH